MRFLKKISIIILCFLLGVIIGTFIILEYDSKSFKAWEWKHSPIIANCYGGDFNSLYIQEATTYWEQMGHEFSFIEENPSKKLCDHDFIDGFIILKKGNMQSDSTLAYTKRKTIIGDIRAATIYFSPGSFKLEHLVTHEMGHAIGYGHMSEEEHIMHPDYEKMGHKFWIPD